MTPFDRKVRAGIYRLFVDEVRTVDAAALAQRLDRDVPEMVESLERLADEHRIALTEGGAVRMAHPFSGVPTSWVSRIGSRLWFANCAWDVLAILALLGDGDAQGPDGLTWHVADGQVQPDGIIHLLVPARHFWDDVGFT